jgi:hypothetical protein
MKTYYRPTVQANLGKGEHPGPVSRLARRGTPAVVLPESGHARRPVSSAGPRPGSQPTGPLPAARAKVGSRRRLTASAKQSVQTMLATWALRELLARREAPPQRRRQKPDEQP